MNWTKLTFDWNQARALVAVADLGSLSAAAKALGLTQPTIGRQISALEAELGVVLVERSGRSQTLTASGREVLEAARAMAEAGLRLSLVASGHAQAVAGPVSISASDMFAHYALPPVLRHLQAIAPALEIDVIASNEISDLKRRDADIAIRHVRPTGNELYARLVREATAHLYAARSYLDQTGRPGSVADLTGKTFVGFGNRAEMVHYLAMYGISAAESDIRFNSANGTVAWEAVRKGLGYGFMAVDFARGLTEVEPVLADEIVVKFPIWLVTHRELHTSPRIRLVFDVLAKALEARP
ncbi:LysR family transcriptional regulator [Pannonibacter sp.]|uniref:LysR family transcriptional regulator n=1 Tax=Pannonibacter sp. TaxID=1906786 RepID=UPI003F72320D